MPAQRIVCFWELETASGKHDKLLLCRCWMSVSNFQELKTKAQDLETNRANYEKRKDRSGTIISLEVFGCSSGATTTTKVLNEEDFQEFAGEISVIIIFADNNK